MSQFMENRLPIMIILFIYLFGMFTANVITTMAQAKITEEDTIFNDSEPDSDIYDDFDDSNHSGLGEQDLEGGWNIFGLLGELWDFLTLQNFGFPEPVKILFNFVNILCSVIFVWLTISFIYDIVKALPLT